ncbi:hypothetical protein PI125_g2044 [Phytophthora idaei]|nr:hypothetical protein PI125_g2044 [Phytophthora idaei]
MADVDWEDLTRKVAEIHRAVYQNSYGRFIAWVVLYKPHLVSPALALRLSDVPSLSFKQLRKRLKPDFELPDCSVAVLWVLWQCGNADKKTPPLRILDGRDMPNKNQQKRLSGSRYLMRMVEEEAKRTGSWCSHQSVEAAVKTFAACEKSVDVPRLTTNNRRRRRRQLSWTSVVALHRRASKQKAT